MGINATLSSNNLVLVSVLWHIKTWELFNTESISVEEQLWYYFTHSWWNKEAYTFPKGINLKVNVMT